MGPCLYLNYFKYMECTFHTNNMTGFGVHSCTFYLARISNMQIMTNLKREYLVVMKNKQLDWC